MTDYRSLLEVVQKYQKINYQMYKMQLVEGLEMYLNGETDTIKV